MKTVAAEVFALLNRFRILHPKFWTFFERLKSILNTNDNEIRQAGAGATIRPQRRPRYVTIENRVKAAETLFRHSSLNADEFLTKASYQIEFLNFKKQYNLTDEDQHISNHNSLPLSCYLNNQFVSEHRPDVGPVEDGNQSEHCDSDTDEADSSGDDFRSTGTNQPTRNDIAAIIMNRGR